MIGPKPTEAQFDDSVEAVKSEIKAMSMWLKAVFVVYFGGLAIVLYLVIRFAPQIDNLLKHKR